MYKGYRWKNFNAILNYATFIPLSFRTKIYEQTSGTSEITSKFKKVG